jgi:hypothetical protein
MTRGEAELRAAALNEQHARGRWFARPRYDGWEVVKVDLPPSMRLDPVKEAVPEATRPTPGGPPPAYHRYFDGPGGV